MALICSPRPTLPAPRLTPHAPDSRVKPGRIKTWSVVENLML